MIPSATELPAPLHQLLTAIKPKVFGFFSRVVDVSNVCPGVGCGLDGRDRSGNTELVVAILENRTRGPHCEGREGGGTGHSHHIGLREMHSGRNPRSGADGFGATRGIIGMMLEDRVSQAAAKKVTRMLSRHFGKIWVVVRGRRMVGQVLERGDGRRRPKWDMMMVMGGLVFTGRGRNVDL